MSPKPLGFVVQAMRARLPTTLQPDREVLRSVLAGLPSQARDLVDQAAVHAQGGVSANDQSHLEVLAKVARVCDEHWRSTQVPAEGFNDPARLLSVLLLDADFEAALPRFRSGELDIETAMQDTLARIMPPHGEAPAPARRSQAARTHAADPKLASRLAALPKARVFSTNAALVLELDELRDPVIHTLRIDAARGNRGAGYDWAGKITLQLTTRELPGFIATVMGWRPSFKATNHGSERNKSMSVENQCEVLYFDLRQGKEGVAVPVEHGDRFQLAMLCTEVLARNHPGSGPQTALEVIRQLELVLPRTR